ncbi:MAG: hydrogenase 4 membrane subunit, partial [Collinsella sp.]
LAISFAHFFVGLTCIISQRNIMKQIFGYCLMENGSHVTLALLAPTAPEIIEIGIATDAIFAVIIMSIVVRRIWDDSHSLDARDLSELRG